MYCAFVLYKLFPTFMLLSLFYVRSGDWKPKTI